MYYTQSNSRLQSRKPPQQGKVEETKRYAGSFDSTFYSDLEVLGVAFNTIKLGAFCSCY